MIQVTHGSIFDSKCDLLIVPCDSAGGVTNSVYRNLAESGLPVSVGKIPFGKVHFRESAYEFASSIGYAASVNAEDIQSDRDAIESIATEILKYARSNRIRIINIPLLGSGAGGLTPIESFEAIQSGLSGSDDIRVNVFCFGLEQYKNISASFIPGKEEKKLRAPRVFISYTGKDKDNGAWSRQLAEQLRQNGVDARLDVFHLKPGHDLPQWMTNEIVMAEKVLLICDRHYIEKSDFRKGGVGWEAMIIQGDMLAQGDNKQKYIAIIREEDAEQGLPIYMKSKYALSWAGKSPDDAQKLKELVMCIFDCDNEPELGPIPSYVKEKLS